MILLTVFAMQVIDLPPIDFSDGRWWIYVLMYLVGRYLEKQGVQIVNGRSKNDRSS